MARTVRLNIAANYVGSGWGALMGFVFVPFYISYLGIEAYGLIGLFTGLQAWLSLLDLGLSSTLNREMARLRGGAHTAQSIRDLLRSVELIYFALAVVIAIVFYFGAGWFATSWLHAGTLPVGTIAAALSITGLVIACRWIGSLYRSALGGLQELVWLNASTVMFATLRGLGVIAVLAFISPTIEAFFIFQGVIAALETLTLGLMVHHFVPRAQRPSRFSLPALRQIQRFAGGVAGTTLLALLLGQADKIVLSGLLPLAQFGHYVLAGTIAGALFIFVHPISVATGPRLAELVARGSQGDLAAAYHRYAQLLSISAIPPAVVVAMFSDRLLLLWTRDPAIAAASAPLASILVLGAMINGLADLPYVLLLALGRTRLTLIANAVAVALLVPALLIVAPSFGPAGAACVWLLVNLVYAALSMSFAYGRLLGTKLGWRSAADLLAPLAAAALGCGAVRFLVAPLFSYGALENAVLIVLSAGLALSAATLATDLGRGIARQLWQRLAGRGLPG